MSGGFKYMGSLNPILLYTFDRDNTYQLGETVYYTNLSDYDSPMLEVKDTHLWRENFDAEVITPSLSLTETMTRYKSFSSGNAKLMRLYPYYLQATTGNKYKKIYTSKNISESSHCAIGEIPQETIDTIDSGDIYTVIFHIDFRYMYPTPTSTFAERITRSNGYISYEHFFDGLESDQFYSTGIDFGYNENTAVIRVMDMLIHISSYTQNQASLHYSNISGTFQKTGIALITMNDVNIIKLEVNKSTRVVTVSNGDFYKYQFAYEVSTKRDIIQIGYNTKMIPHIPPPFTVDQLYKEPLTTIQPPTFDIETIIREDDVLTWYGASSDCEIVLNQYVRTGDFFKIYSTDLEVRLDNIAVFNKAITDKEFQRYYSLHNDLVTHYVRKGYTKLYDFKDFYDDKSTRYLENNEFLSTTLIDDISNELCVRTGMEFDDVYVERHHDGRVEYSLRISGRSMLYDYYNYYYPKFIRNSAYSITFMFKTLSENGTLFAYFDRVPRSNNIFIKFKNGNLEVMIGQSVVNSISGYNNDTFHQIAITTADGTSSIVLNDIVLYTTDALSLYSSTSSCVFGNMHPTMDGLDFNLAMLGYAPKKVSIGDIYNLYNNTIIYKASGVITLNNIRVGATILIYNDHTGELIEKLKSDAVDGVFNYYNRFPHTIMVIVNDDTLMNGRSYIVSPVEII